MQYYRKLMVLTCAAGLVAGNSTGQQVASRENKLQKMQWLIGHWENRMPRAILCETWERSSADLYTGKSYIVKGSDTTMLETIRLEQLKDGLYYIPTTSGQNDGKPVPFKLTQLSGKQAVFENPDHDFPQKISYSWVAPDSLMAEISGPVNGKEKRRQFPMRRAKAGR